jgi:hypothetical protein
MPAEEHTYLPPCSKSWHKFFHALTRIDIGAAMTRHYFGNRYRIGNQHYILAAVTPFSMDLVSDPEVTVTINLINTNTGRAETVAKNMYGSVSGKGYTDLRFHPKLSERLCRPIWSISTESLRRVVTNDNAVPDRHTHLEHEAI